MSRNPRDLTKPKYAEKLSKIGSRWTPIRMSDVRKSGSVCWDCVCSCGNKSPKDDPVSSYQLLNGISKSCGCLRDEGGKEFEKTDRNKKIYNMVRKGESVVDIAEKFDITKARVYQIYNKVKRARDVGRDFGHKQENPHISVVNSPHCESPMSAKNIHHDAVIAALQADGWTITDDPFRLIVGGRKLYVDLAAERDTFAAERDGQKIAVEVQTFAGESDIENLHHAVGQYVVYRAVLELQHPDRILFLAVTQAVYDGILCERVAEIVRAREGIRLLVFAPSDKRIIQWIN